MLLPPDTPSATPTVTPTTAVEVRRVIARLRRNLRRVCCMVMVRQTLEAKTSAMCVQHTAIQLNACSHSQCVTIPTRRHTTTLRVRYHGIRRES
jgi:hypothetical protein